MASFNIPIPIAGFSEGLPIEAQEQGTTGYMSNCRPKDVFEEKLRLGQRPGLKKAYSQQIGGDATPIVWTGSVTTVD